MEMEVCLRETDRIALQIAFDTLNDTVLLAESTA